MVSTTQNLYTALPCMQLHRQNQCLMHYPACHCRVNTTEKCAIPKAIFWGLSSSRKKLFCACTIVYCAALDSTEHITAPKLTTLCRTAQRSTLHHITLRALHHITLRGLHSTSCHWASFTAQQCSTVQGQGSVAWAALTHHAGLKRQKMAGKGCS